MPIAAKNNLDELYAKHRLLQQEAAQLEEESERLLDLAEDADAHDVDRRYILDIEGRALREEATRLSALISDILERDLLR